MPATMVITVKGAEAIQRMTEQIRKQLPFALSTALNSSANALQGAVRQTIPQNFTLRRQPFILNTIYRKKGTFPTGDFASKTMLRAAVRVHPERDVLAKHETAGARAARDGGRLAIPLIRLAAPKTVIGASSRYHLANMPVIPGASAMARVRAKKGPGSTFYATQARKGGGVVIWEGRGARTKPKAIWLLQPGRTPLRPRLGFEQTTASTFERVWRGRFTDALDRALATAR